MIEVGTRLISRNGPRKEAMIDQCDWVADKKTGIVVSLMYRVNGEWLTESEINAQYFTRTIEPVEDDNAW